MKSNTQRRVWPCPRLIEQGWGHPCRCSSEAVSRGESREVPHHERVLVISMSLLLGGVSVAAVFAALISIP